MPYPFLLSPWVLLDMLSYFLPHVFTNSHVFLSPCRFFHPAARRCFKLRCLTHTAVRPWLLQSPDLLLSSLKLYSLKCAALLCSNYSHKPSVSPVSIQCDYYCYQLEVRVLSLVIILSHCLLFLVLRDFLLRFPCRVSCRISISYGTHPCLCHFYLMCPDYSLYFQFLGIEPWTKWLPHFGRLLQPLYYLGVPTT